MTKKDLLKLSTPKEYTKLLKSLGYSERSTGGSHVVFSAINKPSISLPNHKGNIAPGTKRNIDKLILGNSYYTKG